MIPLTLLSLAKGALANWKLVGVGFLALALGIQTMRVGSLKRGEIACKAQVKTYQSVEAAARAKAAQVAKTQAQVTKAATQAYSVTQAHAKAKTAAITKEIPIVLPPSVDRNFPLPNGLVMLYNASAAGNDLPTLPNASASVDDSASAVTASQAAGVFVANNGAHLGCDTQLAALQGWVADEAKAAH